MITIQTHNGRFHADEVGSIALMTSYYSQQGIEVSILRSRNLEDFQNSTILIDVGFEYNHEKFRYDHHQPSFNEVWSEEINVPLSSIGLIWRHYGKEIVEMYLSAKWDNSSNYDENTIEELWNVIYKKLILAIDAHDNGIILSEKDNLNISSIVDAANVDTSNDNEQNEKFSVVVGLVGQIFDIKFKEIINSYFDFQKDFEIISEMNLSGPFLTISKNIKTVFKCISKLDPENNIKFLIFIDENEYTVKTRRLEEQKFVSLCPIADEETLRKKVENPEEILFVHKANFIAKSSTLKTAEEIVKISLENAAKNTSFSDEKEEEETKEEKEEKKEEKKKDEIPYFITGLTGLFLLGGLFYYTKKENA